MRKRAGRLLIGLALCLGITASGAFSAVEADRGVSVAVVDDGSAYVGYDSPDVLTVNTSTTVEESIVTVTNRFPSAITISSVRTETDGIALDYSSANIASGEETTISLVECNISTPQTVAITVTVEGQDVSATVFGDTETRSVEIECVS
jgi:hypothetical protein